MRALQFFWSACWVGGGIWDVVGSDIFVGAKDLDEIGDKIWKIRKFF